MRQRNLLSILVVLLFLVLLFHPPMNYLLVTASGNGSSETNDDWPKFQHDLYNTGYSNSLAPNTNALLWKYKTGADVRSSPAVVNGRVFVGSMDYNVYCLNESTGILIWNYTTWGYILWSSPAVCEGRVFVGSADSYVYCLDALTGTLIWKYKTGYHIWSSPAVVNGRIFIGSDDFNVYCLNASTGALIWKYKTGEGVFDSSPAVVDGRVFIGSGDRNIYCLNETTGALIWNYTTGLSVYYTPAVVDGRVFIRSYCLNESTGELIWNSTAGSGLGSPAVDDNNVFVGSFDYNMYCLDKETGAILWNTTMDEKPIRAPAVADGKVFTGSGNKHVYCLNKTTGAIIWKFKTGAEVDTCPAVANGRVFIGSDDGYVYCFGPEGPSDTTPPTVRGMGLQPSNPKPDDHVIVTANITDDWSGVVNVTLYYRINEEPWGSKSMNQTGDIWTVKALQTLPIQENGVTVDYYIGTEDNYGNKRVSNIYSYTITRTLTTLSCSTSSSEINIEDTITVSGAINPILSGKSVTLTFRKPDGSTVTRTGTTESDGGYSDTYTPDIDGSWSVTASWGGDSMYESTSSSSQSFTVKKSGCLIATATYGSELSPQVQFLRGFRDNTVYSTFAGSSFMTVFNKFYYSFSPNVASVIADNSVLSDIMKVVLYPLIGILHVGSAAFSVFSFLPELGIIVAGLIASSLIGIVYFLPIALIFSLKKKFQVSEKTVRWMGFVLISSVLFLGLAEIFKSPLMMMLSTGTFVLVTITTVTLTSLRTVSKRLIH